MFALMDGRSGYFSPTFFILRTEYHSNAPQPFDINVFIVILHVNPTFTFAVIIIIYSLDSYLFIASPVVINDY